MPVALGQSAGQRTQAEGCVFVIALPRPNSAPDIAAVRTGQDQHAAGLAGKAVGLRPGDRRLVQAGIGKPVLGDEMNGKRAARGFRDEFDGMSDCLPLQAASRAAP